jgi:hypothetical protein
LRLDMTGVPFSLIGNIRIMIEHGDDFQMRLTHSAALDQG